MELAGVSPERIAEARRGSEASSDNGDWFSYARLPDGSDYLRWSGLFEFLVSADGRRIGCRCLNGTSPEAFHTYLLGQVISYSLLKLGIEPLHSTSVVVDGGVAAFLGDCGYGKSSLGAAFLQAGHPLLTDDLLVLQAEGDRFVAHPGPPRIKLFPEVARYLLGERAAGVPMNNCTPKMVIPLEGNGRAPIKKTAPLRSVYILAPPPVRSHRRDVVIRNLSRRNACIQLLRNTFNTVVTEPDRLRRQFDLASRIAGAVPVKMLSYPRSLDRLPEVREAVYSDLAG